MFVDLDAKEPASLEVSGHEGAPASREGIEHHRSLLRGEPDEVPEEGEGLDRGVVVPGALLGLARLGHEEDGGEEGGLRRGEDVGRGPSPLEALGEVEESHAPGEEVLDEGPLGGLLRHHDGLVAPPRLRG